MGIKGMKIHFDNNDDDELIFWLRHTGIETNEIGYPTKQHKQQMPYLVVVRNKTTSTINQSINQSIIQKIHQQTSQSSILIDFLPNIITTKKIKYNTENNHGY